MSDNKDNDMPQDKNPAADDNATSQAGVAGDAAPEPAEAGSNSAVTDPGDIAVTTAPAAPPPPAGNRPVPAPPRSGGGFPVIATLALLLVIGLAFAGGWAVMEGQRREAVLQGRIDDMEKLTQTKVMDADSQRAEIRKFSDSLQSGLEGELRRGLASFEPRLESQTEQLKQLQQALDTLRTEVADNKTEAAGLAEELARYGSSDQEDWLLAEVEYLLRLANQRLIMAGDVQAAEALLGNADNILKRMDDVRLHAVRAALASDLAALRAVPRLDIEGIYLRLSGLSEQADKLTIFQLPDAGKRLETASDDSWKERLSQGYKAALAKVSEYVVVRRRDVPMEALMDPQWEGLVRQNLRMLLEQAQVALLSGNDKLYRQSLERSRHWVEQFFEVDTQAAQAMEAELGGLIKESVSVDLPDISDSLVALEAARRERGRAAEQGGF